MSKFSIYNNYVKTKRVIEKITCMILLAVIWVIGFTMLTCIFLFVDNIFLKISMFIIVLFIWSFLDCMTRAPLARKWP